MSGGSRFHGGEDALCIRRKADKMTKKISRRRKGDESRVLNDQSIEAY